MSARTALLVGNGHFPLEPELADLPGPPTDVARLAALLEDPEIGDFVVEQLVDVESHELLHWLESQLSKASPDDLLLIYYSGHGKLGRRGDLCLACRNTRLETLYSTTVPLALLRSIIDKSYSNRIVMILDCCFSGAAAKAFVRSAVGDQLQLLQGTGIHLLASSTDFQTSIETEPSLDGVSMGAFTSCLVEGLRSGEADVDNDGIVTPAELHRYLAARLRGQDVRYWGLDTEGDLVLTRRKVVEPAELPAGFRQALESPLPSVRFALVEDLKVMATARNKALALAARRVLEELLADDSRRVSDGARAALASLAESSVVGSSEAETSTPEESPIRSELPEAPGASEQDEVEANVVQVADSGSESSQSVLAREGLMSGEAEPVEQQADGSFNTEPWWMLFTGWVAKTWSAEGSLNRAMLATGYILNGLFILSGLLILVFQMVSPGGQSLSGGLGCAFLFFRLFLLPLIYLEWMMTEGFLQAQK